MIRLTEVIIKQQLEQSPQLKRELQKLCSEYLQNQDSAEFKSRLEQLASLLELV